MFTDTISTAPILKAGQKWRYKCQTYLFRGKTPNMTVTILQVVYTYTACEVYYEWIDTPGIRHHLPAERFLEWMTPLPTPGENFSFKTFWHKLRSFYIEHAPNWAKRGQPPGW